MKNGKNLTVLFLVMLIAFVSFAQQDYNLSLYRYHLNTINPAVSGIQEVPYFNTSFRSQWSGIEGAPEIQAFSYETPTPGERVGLGVNIVNETVFIERQLQSFVSFSYRVQLTNKMNLFLGIQSGFNAYQLDAENLKLYGIEGTDPFLNNSSKINPNVGVGAYLKSNKFYLSLSAPRILKTQRFNDLDAVTASDFVHVYFSGGAYFDINKSWQFIPSYFARYVNFSPIALVFNASFLYQDTIDIGVEYNMDSGIGGTLMVDTGSIFSFGYAYLTTVHSAINQFSNGNHELIVKVRLKSKEKNTPIEDIETISDSDEAIGYNND